MRFLKRLAVAAGALAIACGAAAAHGKVGLWNVSITMKTSVDTSHMSPQAQAQLRQMGLLGGKGMTISDQHCMTAAEVARTDFTPGKDGDKNCKYINLKNTSSSMSADMVCTGEFTGSGHMEFTFDGDARYAGHMTMTGTRSGKPSSTDMTFSGQWLKADCGKVKT